MSRGIPRDDIVADVELLRGEPPLIVASRIGATPAAISRALYRTGRTDLVPLARAFRAADRVARPDVYRAWEAANEARRRGTRPSGKARRDMALRRAVA